MKNMVDCVNVSALTFVLGDAQDIDLATIRFTGTNEAHNRQTTDREGASAAYDISGTLDPKDSDGAYKLLQLALENKPFAVYGAFKDANSGDEAEWQLDNVLFDHVTPGRLSDWTFHARASRR